MTRHARFQRGAASSRRKVGWSDGPSQLAPAGISSSGSVLWSLGRQFLFDGQTLVRTRGNFSIWQTVATSIGDGFNQLAVGMCVVSENAFDTGITAVPTPLTDAGWDGWFFHQLLGPILSFETTEVLRGPMSALRIDIDSKAMRKLKSTDVMIGVVEAGVEVGAATLNFVANTRKLVKFS